jgi:hypothetical protein
MNSECLKRRLEALREQRAGSEEGGAEVLEVEPARGDGSYVLQRVLCGKSSLGIERTSGPGCGSGDRLRGAKIRAGQCVRG